MIHNVSLDDIIDIMVTVFLITQIYLKGWIKMGIALHIQVILGMKGAPIHKLKCQSIYTLDHLNTVDGCKEQ